MKQLGCQKLALFESTPSFFLWDKLHQCIYMAHVALLFIPTWWCFFSLQICETCNTNPNNLSCLVSSGSRQKQRICRLLFNWKIPMSLFYWILDFWSVVSMELELNKNKKNKNTSISRQWKPRHIGIFLPPHLWVNCFQKCIFSCRWEIEFPCWKWSQLSQENGVWCLIGSFIGELTKVTTSETSMWR